MYFIESQVFGNDSCVREQHGDDVEEVIEPDCVFGIRSDRFGPKISFR